MSDITQSTSGESGGLTTSPNRLRHFFLGELPGYLMSGVLTVGGLALSFYDQLAAVGVDLRELVGHFVATERVGTVMTVIGLTVVVLRLLVQALMKKE